MASELEEKYKIKTRVVAVDFNNADLVQQKIADGIKVSFNETLRGTSVKKSILKHI